MNGYTRAKNVSTARSRSIDFSDLSGLPTPKPISNYSSNPSDSKISHEKKIPEKSMDIHAPIQENKNEDGAGEIFGVILSRKCSVSSTSSHDYFISDQKENASLQSAVKRVFSMKRSSSVSEGYCRIHHQCDPNADDDDGSVTLTAFKTRSIKKKGKILRACRRIFGF